MGLERIVSLLSAAVGWFSYRQDQRHHSRSTVLAREHHKQMSDLEAAFHREAQTLGQRALRAEAKMHRESRRLDRKLHQATAKLDHKLHHAQLCASLEQHLQDITSSLVTAGREADRDMWDQRNAQFQTLLLASTVMFGAGMAVIVEGELPTATPEAIVIAFGVSIGCSFATLFISIILSLRVVISMSRFMYQLTNHHQSVVTNLVINATVVMDRLVQIQNQQDAIIDFEGLLETAADSDQASSPRAPAARDDRRRSTESYRRGSTRTRRQSQVHREQYQNLVRELSARRRQINRYLAAQYLFKRFLSSDRGGGGDGQRGTQNTKNYRKSRRRGRRAASQPPPSLAHSERAGSRLAGARHGMSARSNGDGKTRRGRSMESAFSLTKSPSQDNLFGQEPSLAGSEDFMTEFEAFWASQLQLPAAVSMVFFYVGTSALLVTISFLIFARFTITLNSQAGAYVFVCFIYVSLAGGMMLYLCWKKDSYREFIAVNHTSNDDSDEANEDDDVIFRHDPDVRVSAAIRRQFHEEKDISDAKVGTDVDPPAGSAMA